MIIVSDKPGQLCNQMIIHSNLYLFCKKNKIILINPSLYNYKGYFREIKIYPGSKTIFLFFNFLAKIARKLKIKTNLFSAYSIGYDEYCDLDSLPKKSSIFSHLCLAMGWQFRTTELIKKNRKEILEIFSPSSFYELQIKNFISQTKTLDSVLIGVHLRRGDYVRFEGGKYFYDLETYIRIINNLFQLFQNQKIKLLFFSNEHEFSKIIQNHFQHSVIAPGHELVDLYCLAECDYIIGPPSTYSLWASYYGGVPLYLIENPKNNFQLNDFKIIDGF